MKFTCSPSITTTWTSIKMEISLSENNKHNTAVNLMDLEPHLGSPGVIDAQGTPVVKNGSGQSEFRLNLLPTSGTGIKWSLLGSYIKISELYLVL